MITKIYNKKTKEPILVELFTATGILKKFFLTTRDVRCVHHRWHGTHRYDIQVLATHINMDASIFFTAAMICALRSCGNGGTNTQSLTYPQRKNHRAYCQGTSGAIASVVGHFQMHTLYTVLVTLCSGTGKLHGGNGWDFVLLEYERRYVLQLWH